MSFKPMLSASAKSVYELRKAIPEGGALASPKLDGIRCVILPDQSAVSRNLKPIPNDYIRSILRVDNICHLDGELITYTGGLPDDFNTVQSKVMSKTGTPSFKFHVFDCFLYPNSEFKARLLGAMSIVRTMGVPWLELVSHLHVGSTDEFLEYAQKCILHGYEGAMLRDPEGGYKYGRSTLTEAWLVKWKEFQDAEGIVAGFEEKMHNANEATVDALGRTERSSHRAGMVPAGTLGALVLDTQWGQLRVGTGFTDQQRAVIWAAKSHYIGKTVTFKYQAEGSKDLPRFPVFKSWRED